MDSLTHALASFTLQRAAFPRLSRTATIAVVISGVIADTDLLSSYFGPSAYLSFDRTYFHSLPAALVLALLATLPFFFLKPKSPAPRCSQLHSPPPSFISPSTFANSPASNSSGPSPLAASRWTGSPLST